MNLKVTFSPKQMPPISAGFSASPCGACHQSGRVESPSPRFGASVVCQRCHGLGWRVRKTALLVAKEKLVSDLTNRLATCSNQDFTRVQQALFAAQAELATLK